MNVLKEAAVSDTKNSRQMEGLKRRPFVGISGKMILCCVLSTVFTIILSDVVIYNIYQKNIVEKEFAYMEDSNKMLADSVSNLVDGIENNLVSDMEYFSVFSYQEILDKFHIANMERSLKSVSTIMKMRKTIVKSIYIFDRFSCSYYFDTEEKTELDDFKQKTAYKEIREKQKTLFPRQGSTLWRRYEDNPDEIYLIKYYIDSKSTDYKGIVCLTFDKSYMEELLGEHDFSNIVYDENGNLLYCDDKLDTTNVWKDETVREQYMISSDIVDRNKWKIEILLDKEVIIKQMERQIRDLLIVELIVLTAVVLVITYLFRGMLRNIIALNRNFKDINAGKSAVYINPHTNDETAYLCRQFNVMYRELTQSVEKMAHDSTLREKAEYKALLAQMNPHFLYNSLESISSMAKLSGNTEIVQAIHMLGHLLRASINGDRQKVKLKNEIEYISYYLELQKLVTAGTHIEWDFSIDSDTEEYLVPKLILQPVVENSIIHGLKNISRDGMIVITANKNEDSLIIKIYDNGVGTLQENIDNILKDEKDDAGQSRDHIGIRIIQKRIQILYGAMYGMQIESSPGNGMIVKITLPLEKEAEDV